METFVGRKKELDILQRLHDRNSFNMAIIYGRRRIGKTMLICEFMKHQTCKKIFFTSVEQNEKTLLSMMTNSVLSALSPEMNGLISFPDFNSLFEFVGQHAQNEKIIFFIDEYPYLARECPGVQSLLQKHIDNNWKNTNLTFILCGSLIGFMKDEVLAESAPLYGRSDLELKLRPFGYDETALFLPDYTNEEKAIVYGLTGGVAKYIRQFDPDISLDKNIINQFFSLGGYFSEEQVKTVLTSERQNPVIFNSIIAAVASGHTKYNEISTYTNSEDVSYALKVLTKAEILEKRISKKPYYILNDSMLEFWFRYVLGAINLINTGNGSVYYYSKVKFRIHEFMGKIFEKMAKDFLFKRAGTMGIPLMSEIMEFQGSYKDKDGKPFQIELDLLGKDEKKLVLAGECKFRNEKFDKENLEEFQTKVNLMHGENLFLCIFSLSGYSEYVIEHANGIKLFTIDDMFDEVPE